MPWKAWILVHRNNGIGPSVACAVGTHAGVDMRKCKWRDRGLRSPYSHVSEYCTKFSSAYVFVCGQEGM